MPEDESIRSLRRAKSDGLIVGRPAPTPKVESESTLLPADCELELEVDNRDEELLPRSSEPSSDERE